LPRLHCRGCIAEERRSFGPTRAGRSGSLLDLEEAMPSSPLSRHPLFADTAVLDLPALGHLVLSSLIFAIVGIIVFGAAFWVITKIAPFSIRKEIEEDQNTSLGIVIGAVIIGLSLIISAAIKG
jgi:putative membrane protein